MEEGTVFASQGIGGYERGELNGSIEQKENGSQYTIQSVMHFIQSEWRRMELQNSQWLMERSELRAQIAFLQGERRGQENLKQDLIRRIKMLEHALKQERVRYHQLKASITSGQDHVADENAKSGLDFGSESLKDYKHILDPGQQLARCTEQAAQSNAKWRESRQRLKYFLQELGYTDSVLEVRQNRVRQLLCATGVELSDQAQLEAVKNGVSSDRDLQNLQDTEEAVMHTFDFLEAIPKDKSDSKPPGELNVGDADASWPNDMDRKSASERNSADASFVYGLNDGTDPNAVKRFGRKAGLDHNLKEFLNLLSDRDGGGEIEGQKADSVWPPSDQAGRFASREGDAGAMSGTGSIANFSSVAAPNSTVGNVSGAGLGDLASLTVANESDNGNDADQCDPGFIQGDIGFASKEGSADTSSCLTPATLSSCRRPWAKKYVLRGHFDGIRSVIFHPTEPFVFTSGEDGLVMLWALHYPNYLRSGSNSVKAGGSGGHGSGASAVDLDAVHMYRGHCGPVLALSVPASGQCASSVFSAGLDGVIRGWRLPTSDPSTGNFDLYAPSQLATEMGPVFKRNDVSETVAVWDLSVHPVCPLLTSVDASAAVSFWPLRADIEGPSPAAITPSRTILLTDLITPGVGEASVGRATCLTYLGNRPDPANATHCLVGTNTGWLAVIDIETGRLVNKVSPPLEPMKQDSDQMNTASSQDLHSITFPASGWGPRGVHALTVHNTLSLAISGHEDKRIRFHDIGRMGGDADSICVETMVTHLDAVTCLTVDPHDLYLLTGSHDKSIRLWDLETRTCVQEMTCHRSKNNEGVHHVAMHQTLPFAASAGADATCKIYMCQ
uniref:Striatin-3 n=1 Tax=Schistocephalus solidus TaxID=70667 RepID=A0A0X3PLF4_SCHSO